MQDRSSENFIKLILDLFAQGGAKAYGRTGVTMIEHMLQTAAMAERSGAPDHLVAAALLHDIGHFGTDLPWGHATGRHAEMRRQRVDRHHEEAGARLLTPYFRPEITEPVRLHVAAKRYLCAVEPSYFDKLSPTTKHTLKLQGGPMTPAEVHEFEAKPHSQDAAVLRRWDDNATIPGLRTPSFEYYRDLLQGLCAHAHGPTR